MENRAIKQLNKMRLENVILVTYTVSFGNKWGRVISIKVLRDSRIHWEKWLRKYSWRIRWKKINCRSQFFPYNFPLLQKKTSPSNFLMESILNLLFPSLFEFTITLKVHHNFNYQRNIIWSLFSLISETWVWASF